MTSEYQGNLENCGIAALVACGAGAMALASLDTGFVLGAAVLGVAATAIGLDVASDVAKVLSASRQRSR